jgi:hypothetical protein
MGLKFNVFILASAAVLVSCTPKPFVNFRPDGTPENRTLYPLPLVVGVEEMPPLEKHRDYASLNFEGDLRSAVRRELIRWLDGMDFFFYVGPLEDLPGEPDLVIKPTLLRFEWKQQSGSTYPLLLSAASLGTYPLFCGAYWWPYAYFRLHLEVRDRNAKPVARYMARGAVEDEVSLYRSAENSPQVLLRHAFTIALKKLSDQLVESQDRLSWADEAARPARYGPPIVLITSPADGSSHPAGSVTFSGRILVREGISQREFRFNGMFINENAIEIDTFGGDMIFFIYKGDVKQGRNVFECRVTDKLNRYRQVFITVYGKEKK